MVKPKKSKGNRSDKVVHSEHVDQRILQELDGEKGDLDLFGGIDDDEDAIDCAEDLEAEPIRRDQVRDYIKKLGFDKLWEGELPEAETEAVTSKTPKLEPNTDEGGNSVVKEEKREKKKKNKFKLTEDTLPHVVLGDEIKSEVKQEESVTKERREKKKKNKFKDSESVQVEEISSTTVDILNVDFIRDHVPLAHLVVKPGTKWFEYGVSDDTTSTTRWSVVKVTQLLDHVTQLHQEEVALYKTYEQSNRRSDSAWTHKVLTSGTLADKMAAWTLLIQEAPVHNMSCLDNLVTMVNKKGRREALLAMDTLKELFLTELLCDNRKLRSFDQHPLHQVGALAGGNKDSRDKRLILWYYEHCLKQKYAEFIHGLETVCHDTLREAKQKAIATVFALLAGKPEQEKKLLSLLCNKLGDPDYRVASNTAHLLIKLVQKHPNMKQVIVTEVERLMYRPNMAAKAQYYAVCFLNQILLSPEESELSIRLINIYFSFFKSFIKKGEVDSKMLSALLTGVNRAYPYTKGERGRVTDQLDTLYRVVHVVNFNTSVQALMLLHQVMDSSESTSDRYFQALYRKLLDPSLISSSKQTLFLSLLFKSMKQDTVERRVKAFIKRLLQVCCGLPPPFICGALIMLSELMKTKPGLFQFSHFSQDSDDEHFDDADTDEDENIQNLSPEQRQMMDTQNALGHTGHMTTSSWVHRQNTAGVSTDVDGYNGQHRNPLYCHADHECVWELEKLTNHFHPTVALFSSNILQGEAINYPGDPLEDFSFIRFLDRFVYKNPKKREKDSKEKNRSHTQLQAKSRHQAAAGARALAVNSAEYLRRRDIPVEERFFHRYFKSQADKRVAKEVEDVTSDVSDDEFDHFLDDYEKGMDGAEFDFAGEFTKRAAKTKIDGDDDDDEDDLDDVSDEEVDFGDDADFKAAFGDMDSDLEAEDGDLGGDKDIEDEDFDEEAVEFSDEDEFNMEPRQTKRRGGVESGNQGDDPDSIFLEPPPDKRRRADKHDTASLFAAADEFADVMDDNAAAEVSTIGSEALSNQDKAGAKQLLWEQSRHQWLQGTDWKTRKRGKHGQTRDKHVGSNDKRSQTKGKHSQSKGKQGEISNKRKNIGGKNEKGQFGAKKGGKFGKNIGHQRGKKGGKSGGKGPRKGRR